MPKPLLALIIIIHFFLLFTITNRLDLIIAISKETTANETIQTQIKSLDPSVIF